MRKNVIAAYASQGYSAASAIIVVPFYLAMLGTEAYGLIGFFASLQVVFNLFDLGLSAALSREAARFQASGTALQFRRLHRIMSWIFLVIALGGMVALWMGSNFLATRWLGDSTLDTKDIQFCIQVMSLSLALRWYAGLKRGILNGLERQVTLAAMDIGFATLRYFGAVAFLHLAGASIRGFFAYQAILAILEFGTFVLVTRPLLPKVSERIGYAWKPIQQVLRFSLSIAFAALVWVAVTQSDKILLSALLPLDEYAYFMLATAAAGAVTLVVNPISLALRPRLARLDAEGNQVGMIQTYRMATQFVAVLGCAVALSLASLAGQFLWAWTGDAVSASRAAPILALYAGGNAALGLAAFPYYLQFAKGNLRLHVLGNIAFALVLIPSVLLAAWYRGAMGAGVVWLTANLAFLFGWSGLVHHRFAPGLHVSWLLRDIIPTLLAAASVAVLLAALFPEPSTRGVALVQCVFMGIATLTAGTLASSQARHRAVGKALTWWRTEA